MLASVTNTSKLPKKKKKEKKKWSCGSWPHGQCIQPQDKIGGTNYWHSTMDGFMGLLENKTTHLLLLLVAYDHACFSHISQI
jgi:hypothetical protein